MEALQSHSLLSFSSNISKINVLGNPSIPSIKLKQRTEIVSLGMLAPRKFMQKKKKVEVFKDAADEAEQKRWRKLMNEIDEAGSAVSILRNQRAKGQALPKDLVLGTLMRFKQLKKWNLVSEILEWLRCQHWWDFKEMDFLMLITAYGKLGDFNKAGRVLGYMNKHGYPPSVISHTALMEAYGRARQYNKAEAIFRRMQTSGPAPSPITYQIILKTFVEADKYKEAEAVFETLLNDESSFKPDQKMFHMMIYMHKKAGNYEQARMLFTKMSDRGIPQSTVTYNSLMSFETNYKEVSKIYDQECLIGKMLIVMSVCGKEDWQTEWHFVEHRFSRFKEELADIFSEHNAKITTKIKLVKMQRAGVRPDVVSYALLISAYGKARREDEALAVFEEMLDAGVRPTRKAYNILLDAFAVSGMVEEARKVFKSMRRDKCTPDLVSYTTMLSAYVNASDMEGAEKFFKRLKQDGYEPNVVTYGTLLKGYAKVNDLEKMMKVYDDMRLQGLEVNQTIFTTIMDAHGKNTDFGSAAIWYKEMESSGLVPDQKAKNILLSLAKSAEEQEEANQLVGNIASHFTERRKSGVSEQSDDDNDDYYDSGDEENGDESFVSFDGPINLERIDTSDVDEEDDRVEARDLLSVKQNELVC